MVISLLTSKQASERYGIPEGTLRKRRLDGTGAPFRKKGGRVYYVESEFVEWLLSEPFKSTSEYKSNGKQPRPSEF